MAPARIRSVAFAIAAFVWLFAVGIEARAAPQPNSWTWPVVGPVIREFEPPPCSFCAGHRGIDIATRFGTPVLAPAGGKVSFAGSVAGSLFVTIDHGDGYLSTSSYVSTIYVKKGDVVRRGEVIGLSGHGHPEIPEPTHLHFGVRLNGAYIDPRLLLEPASVVDIVYLAPIQGQAAASFEPFEARSPPPRMSSFDPAEKLLVARDRRSETVGGVPAGPGCGEPRRPCAPG